MFRICQFFLKEGWLYQIVLILAKIPNGLRPLHLIFGELYCNLVSKKSLGIGLENFGLKKSLGIGLENFGLKKSLSNDLKKFVLENFGLQKLWTW